MKICMPLIILEVVCRAIADTLQFLEVGARESNIRLFQCPVGLVPIGFGARSTCRSLKDFKVIFLYLG